MPAAILASGAKCASRMGGVKIEQLGCALRPFLSCENCIRYVEVWPVGTEAPTAGSKVEPWPQSQFSYILSHDMFFVRFMTFVLFVRTKMW